ncbi:hypothetical protein [Streptomyces sp. RFCAC02]|uniref:hypothetical protein n=1 Tax=Streptomyces sp. RFCAC02 TaxID=2499143 RepID=UPI00102129A3|nr:hypothetical protein [Streptomyces sp. RFCAC02]
MTGSELFALSFDPRALSDLLQAPGDIRDLALAQIQDAVRAQLVGRRLHDDLTGYRKLYVDSRNAWRTVYTQRPAPRGSARRVEIHVVALRPRAGYDIYRTVRERLGLAHPPVGPRPTAARTRSPQRAARTGTESRIQLPAPPARQKGPLP